MALKSKRGSSSASKSRIAKAHAPAADRQVKLGKECNDPIAAYTKTVEIPYGDAQPRENCGPPTDEEEGDALDKAKKAFKGAAAKYCAKGDCPPPQTCGSTVSIASIENLGVVSTPDGHLKRCAIKFKITGRIVCTCPGAA